MKIMFTLLDLKFGQGNQKTMWNKKQSSCDIATRAMRSHDAPEFNLERDGASQSHAKFRQKEHL